MHNYQYFSSIILKYKWIIVAIVCISICAVVVFCKTAAPLYQSETEIYPLVMRKSPDMISLNPCYQVKRIANGKQFRSLLVASKASATLSDKNYDRRVSYFETPLHTLKINTLAESPATADSLSWQFLRQLDFAARQLTSLQLSTDSILNLHEMVAWDNYHHQVDFADNNAIADDGSLYFVFPKLGDLLGLDTTGLKGKVDMVSSDKAYILQGAAVDNQLYLDFGFARPDGGMKMAFSMLGERENAFHFRLNFDWGEDFKNKVVMNAMYDDRTLTLYDSSGQMGSLHLDNMALMIDFAELLIDGSLDVKNEVLTPMGTYSTQKGKVTISAKGESISDRLIQIFTGSEYNIDFNVGISDVTLEDGYEIADLSIDMNLSNDGLSFSGNLVNGRFDPIENYIDISIDRELLFGFNARGYLGSELDLMVTDIYFPLPILNQLMNSTMMEFINGTIEGDVLIKGPTSNLSLYGMAYCKSFEMSLYYLPDQVITVKNVALSLHDHEL